jgi:mannosyltransferase OCH1-like enzyme
MFLLNNNLKNKNRKFIPNVYLKDVPNLPFVLKEKYNSVIPLKIFQTWKTNDLSPLWRENQEKLKRENPEFEYFLYDDEDCRQFISEYFGSVVLDAFDSLIPGAYKADLWRCCVLYVHGGIYLDMRFEMINGFKLIALTEKEHFSLERSGFWMPGKHGIYNGLIVSKPGNPFLMACIAQIIQNVKTRYYGLNPLYPTGPGLLWLIHERNKKWIGKNIDIFLVQDSENNLLYKNRVILHSLDNYETLRIKTPHYHKLWEQRKIYK